MTTNFPVSPAFPHDLMSQALEAASGVQVQWATRKAPVPGLRADTPKAWLEAYVTNSVDVGWDERLLQLDTTTDPPTQQALTIGRREATVSLQAYSLDPKLGTLDLLERVRFGWNRVAILAILQPIIAIRWCERIVKLPDAERDGRLLSRANMDVQISYVVAADTLDPGVDGYVLSVTNPTGTPQP